MIPRRLLLLHLLHLHRQRQDRLQHPLTYASYHRRCGCCASMWASSSGYGRKRHQRSYPPALIEASISFRRRTRKRVRSSAIKKPSCKEFRRPNCAPQAFAERNRRKAAATNAEMATSKIGFRHFRGRVPRK